MQTRKNTPINLTILGENRSGRASLIERYCKNEFNESLIGHVMLNFASKTLPLNDRNLIINLNRVTPEEISFGTKSIYHPS